MLTSPSSEQTSSSENREIDEVVQQICDITLKDDNGDDNDDDDVCDDDKYDNHGNDHSRRHHNDARTSRCQFKGCGLFGWNSWNKPKNIMYEKPLQKVSVRKLTFTKLITNKA
jgi:hypothetical protein